MTEVNNPVQPARTKYTPLIFLLMLVPFLVYFQMLSRYLLDMPYWDDFSVIVWRVNNAMSAPGAEAVFREMFANNAGHTPAVTRLIALWQAKFSGGINFKYSTMAGNAGWALTTLILVFYFRQKLKLSWLSLLPVPFIMLTLNHWEAMDFMTPAWQMYWGAALLPVIFFLAIAESRNTVAVYSFTAAIFLSSGSIALYPLALACYFIRRQWMHLLDFAIRAGIALAFFFYLNPPQDSGGTLNIPLLFKYVPAFMGNLVSNGLWDISPLFWIHIPLGLCIIALGTWMTLSRQAPWACKLIFVYVMLLAGMAAFLRGSGFDYVVSRYALFAAMAATCLYAYYAAVFAAKPASPMKQKISALLAILPILLWAHSIYICRTPLQLNYDQRLNGVQAYLTEGADPGKYIPIVWDFSYGKPIMDKAKALGIYDPAVLQPLITPKP